MTVKPMEILIIEERQERKQRGVVDYTVPNKEEQSDLLRLEKH